jgi:predicted HTH transcriptional regulator
MTEQEIYNILADGERVTLECKKAQSKLPSSLWETYSAFANTYGGTILLGVYENLGEIDNAQRFSITGVEDADKILKDLWNTIHSSEKVNINLLRDEDVDKVSIDGKVVVVVNVPQADYTLRPIYINNNMQRGTYKRNHEGGLSLYRTRTENDAPRCKRNWK